MNRRRHQGVLAIPLTALLAFTTPASAGGAGLSELPDRPSAPEFTLTDVDGVVHRLSGYRGKVVIVNFWATWCPPCREEMPSMQRAWEQVRDEGILMVAVDVGENGQQVSAFREQTPVDFPLLLDEDSSVTTAWPVRGLPTTYVVDTRGRLAYQAVGGREWDDPDLLATVRALRDTDAAKPQQ